MKARLVQFKNLKFEIPEDEDRPILIKWMDKDNKLVDVFEVNSGDEEKKLEEFMKELTMQEEVKWSHTRKGNIDKDCMNVNIPKKIWEDMGRPVNFSVGYDSNNKLVSFRGDEEK